MIVSLLLIGAGIIGLGTLLYRFAVYALPAIVGVLIGSLAFHSGTSLIGAFVIGSLTAGITLALAQLLFAVVRPLPLRALILLGFVLPAAYMGHSMVLQLCSLGSLSTFWQEAFAVVGAIAIGSSAAVKLSRLGPRSFGQPAGMVRRA